MSKFIIKIFSFIIIILIVNQIYLYVIKRIDWNFYKSTEAIEFKDKSFDCIILGNSLAMDGIDSEFLTTNGLSSYNFAIGGANLKASFLQLEKYIRLNNNPKIVLLGLSSCIDSKFDSEQIHPIIDYNYNMTNKMSLYELPMVKFKWMGQELLKKIFSADHRKAKIILGQLKISRTIPDKTKYRDHIQTQLNVTKYKQSICLSKIDSFCHHNGIDLLLIELPGFRNMQNDISIGPIKIENKEGHIYNLINLNNRKFCSEYFEDDKDWLGQAHLNLKGARKLTKFVFDKFLVKYRH